MKTDWLFQEPIDFEHKQYTLLGYLQKVEKNLKDHKLYPDFQMLSLHLANISLLIEKGQYITLNRVIKEPDDEILLSDIIFNNIIKMNREQYSETFEVCRFSIEKFKTFFEYAKSIWEITNDTTSINVIKNKTEDNPKSGLFFIDVKGKKILYEFFLKSVKKNGIENKCVIKKIGECDLNTYKEKILTYKNPLNKNLKIYDEKDQLTILEIIHSNGFPIRETVLPIAKRKILNYLIQSKTIKNKNLTSS